jgi:hypothetical protein
VRRGGAIKSSPRTRAMWKTPGRSTASSKARWAVVHLLAGRPRRRHRPPRCPLFTASWTAPQASDPTRLEPTLAASGRAPYRIPFRKWVQGRGLQEKRSQCSGARCQVTKDGRRDSLSPLLSTDRQAVGQ